jgi:iron(III) transport system permease protein
MATGLSIYRRVFSALSMAPFLFLVYAHLAVLSAQLLMSDSAAGLMVPSGRRAALLARSILASAAVAVLATALGWLAGRRLWLSRGSVSATLRIAAFGLVFLPAYVHSAGWSPFFGAWVRNWAPGSLASAAAGIWVQTMAFLPVAVLLAIAALHTLGSDLLEAGAVAREPAAVWKEVVLPHTRPMLAAAAGCVFVLAFLDYSIPSLFGVATYSMEIFTQFGADPSPPRALALALPLVLVAAAVLAASLGPVRRVTLGHVSATGSIVALRPRNYGSAPELLALAVLCAQAAVAIGFLFSVPNPAGAAIGAWNSARHEVIRTFSLALLTALLSVPVGMPVALAMCAGGRRGRWWWALVLFPMAVPGSLAGVGLIGFWNRPGLDWMYGSPLILMATWLARFLPLAALLLAAFLSRLDTLQIDAARVFGVNPVQGWGRVRLPLLRSGFLATAALVFALSVGEVGASLIVAPPGCATVSMRIYSYLHAGARDGAAGLCMIQMLAVLAGGAAVVRLTRHRTGGR